ncbi:phosphotransferase family protein [Streptomyces sp. NBC_00582]|uniref:phosphotransferase family protein n=1 Tax=Streptomyces sp. NBC_00582 TaxID=2975783 RepID=UPI001063FD58|nr:phosphotransferase family protein [Streptomyces sp. NBC_00582]WUB59299.1 phosphotransferase family protein [Streptomyces sp. NBC_00582]
MSTDLPGLPAASIEKWLQATLPDLLDGGPWHAELISGGLSNITYRLHLPHTTVILRRPPLGRVLPSAHDMKREYRIQTALAGTGVPVPRTLALCTDPDVLGCPFYVMAEVPGQIMRTADDTAGLTPETRSALADGLVRTLADLHGVDPSSAGLADFGRPQGYCARQIVRWGEQWQRSHTRELPDMGVLLNRLSEHVPTHSEASIVHGDYRLDNTIVDMTESPRIAGVLDWELSTLGDPLADLGMTLTYWHDDGDTDRELIPVAVGVTTQRGFPTSREVAEKYAALTGRDLSLLPFYLAFSSMKLAVIFEGVHARYLRGQTVSEGYEGAGAAVPVLVSKALRELRALAGA